MSSFWLETIRAKVLKRNRKSITIPAFAVRSGDINGSWLFNPASANPQINFEGYTTGAGAMFNSAVTVEGWAKAFGIDPSPAMVLFFLQNESDVTKLGLFIENQQFNVTRTTAVNTVTYNTGVMPPQNSWFHFALVYNSTNFRLFINNVLVWTQAFATALVTVTEHKIRLGLNWNGNIAEVRFWSVILTPEQMLWNYNTRRGINSGLEMYFKANDSTQVVDFINPLQFFPQDDASYTFDTEDYPPLIYRASSVAGQFEIEAGVELSIKYPVEVPENANFMLVVRCLDAEGDTVRYKLWDMEGVKFYPVPERYRGQKLPEDFVLEAWCIDGMDNCTMEEDLVILVSKNIIPTSQTDESNPEIVDDPVIDISLSEPFPLTPAPYEFNTEGWGTVAAPATQPVGSFSTGLTVYGNIQ